ncbi:MAG TPA: hypothetical protein VF808_10600 [Ktedonobacterales bacterium]
MKLIRWLVWLSLGLALCLAGCGVTSAKDPSSTATIASPTMTPTSTSLTPDASQLAACDLHSSSGVTLLGDLLVTGPGLTNIAYPARKLPDGTPLAPLRLESGDALNTQLPPDPAVSPNMTSGGGGYGLSVCNSSPVTSHVVQGVSVRIEAVTPYSGELSAWNICDGSYDAATKQAGAGGCGGGFCANETLKATFATATAGASASVTAEGSDKDISGGCGPVVFGPLPVSLKPHQTIFVNIGVALTGAPATYTFAFGVAQDGAATSYLPDARPALLAPITHKWTGAACASSAMQSQIPPASSTTLYICPVS